MDDRIGCLGCVFKNSEVCTWTPKKSGWQNVGDHRGWLWLTWQVTNTHFRPCLNFDFTMTSERDDPTKHQQSRFSLSERNPNSLLGLPAPPCALGASPGCLPQALWAPCWSPVTQLSLLPGKLFLECVSPPDIRVSSLG